MNGTIAVIQADITQLQVDAIVNAANSSLLGGGGVDGAIHRSAGPQLLLACQGLNGCRTGDAKITPGFNLPARYVIHTVGPIWLGGVDQEAELLAACYRNSLNLAAQHQVSSLAFPCISTGVYGFPPQQAAQIAVATVKNWLIEHASQLQVIFCCYTPMDEALYLKILANELQATSLKMIDAALINH